jgi:DNA ligase-1
MLFSTLSNYYEKLEATSKRLELVDILSKLFGESDSTEIGKICYLIQGRVAPFYMPVEMGMAESMVAQAIAKAYGKTKDDVIKSYRHLGNIGLAAQELAKSHKASANLSVADVFGQLRKIADLGGEGSVEQKITTLSDLLKNLDPISVKHVVNIPLGTLRLGIGDPTVMDALSIAKTGDKKLRPVIEDAYNKTSDLGYVAEEFFSRGEKGLSTIKLIVGKPVRPALAERMPNADEVVKRMGDKFAAEPKFDGFRVQIHKSGDKIEIFSRNLEDMTHSFPDLAEGVLKEVKAKSVIMEGEAIAYNPLTEEFLPFQETTKRRRKYKIEETAKALPLVCFAFDILYFNGEDICGKPEIERRKLLEKIVSKYNQTIRIAEQRVISTAKEIQEFFNEAISDGLEGLMIKKLDAPYKAGGRGFHWIKFKRASSGDLADTVDCVLLGIYSGKGKRTDFGVGGLLVGIYNDKDDVFETISRVGTGLTDEEFRKVHEIGKKLRLEHKPARVRSKIEPNYWVEPREVLEIYADEITKSPIHTAGWDEKTGTGYALRFPRLVKFREKDKRAEDATTVEEMKKLYKNQYGKK